MTPRQVITALAMYLYRTSVDDIVSDVYGEDILQEYREEKARLLKDGGFGTFYRQLDEDHQQRFVDAATKKNGKKL